MVFFFLSTLLFHTLQKFLRALPESHQGRGVQARGGSVWRGLGAGREGRRRRRRRRGRERGRGENEGGCGQWTGHNGGAGGGRRGRGTAAWKRAKREKSRLAPHAAQLTAATGHFSAGPASQSEPGGQRLTAHTQLLVGETAIPQGHVWWVSVYLTTVGIIETRNAALRDVIIVLATSAKWESSR